MTDVLTGSGGLEDDPLPTHLTDPDSEILGPWARGERPLVETVRDHPTAHQMKGRHEEDGAGGRDQDGHGPSVAEGLPDPGQPPGPST